MNIEQINSYIEKKEVLDQKAIAQIMLLIEKYPYFQTAHMLLLKALHMAQPEKFNGQLQISGSFISDKKKLYQYINADIQITTAQKEEKNKELVKTPIEIKKTEKAEESKIKDKTDIVEQVLKVEKKAEFVPEILTEPVFKEVKEEKINEPVIIKPEIKKKVDLPDDEIERMANQHSEVKHKKIVDDFFNLPVKEKSEKKAIEPEIEILKEKGNGQEIKVKKEFPGKLEIKALLEEKKRNLIAKNEFIKEEKKITPTQEFKKTEIEIPEVKIQEEEKTSIEFILKQEPEKTKIETVKKPEIEKEKIKESEKIEVETIKKQIPEKKQVETFEDKKQEEETIIRKKVEFVDKEKEKEVSINGTSKNIEEIPKKELDSSDAMNSIFSKIRQIKKEMNITPSNTPETIDVNPKVETPKIIRTQKGEETKTVKVIKESFIGFEESEIKSEDLIGDSYNKDKKQESTEKTEQEEIKESGLTAKDLFKKHLKIKEKTIEPPIIQEEKTNETKSPISKVIESINQNESKLLEEKKEEPETVIENIQPELKEEPILVSEKTSEEEGKLSAAEALLKRIAEKKKLLREEKEREVVEKQKEKEIIKAEPPQNQDLTGIEKVEEKVSESIPVIEEEKNVTLTSGEVKENKSQKLIDSFIQKVDTLERLGNKESSLVGDISEKSTEERDEFMTETMADLFIKQKNYEKAIEIYNKLILKFPEKKTYFAIQIKKTESLIK